MSADLSGRILGRVRLQEVLGEGGAGVVYRGRHTTLDKAVAVKVLKLGSNGNDKRYAERFRREARLAASIEDPSIVRVIDYGEEEGLFFLVMDYIDGYPLGRYLRSRREPIDELTAVKILLAVANALNIAHRAGIVHRDLKPDNLLLSRKGSLHLADLGLAKGEGMGDLTQDRYVVGSPAYMAPESFTPGLEVDHRCDLYALGIIGYQLLYGEHPYRGEVDQILQGHRAGTADFNRVTPCSKRLVGVVARLMAVSREDRFQSAQELIEDLRPHFATLKKKQRKVDGSASGSGSGSTSTYSAGSSEFAGIVRFIETRLGSHTTTHRGGQVTHTTTRERLLVWLLLLAFIGVALAGWWLSSGDGVAPEESTSAIDTTATDEADPAPGTAVDSEGPRDGPDLPDESD